MIPVKPVAAATVILIRDGEPAGSPWQCYMVRRHIRSDFASNVFVFPGGKVDDGDAAPDLRPFLEAGMVPLQERAPAESVRVAAIRELFEEAGILLARGTDQEIVRFDGAAEKVEEMRAGLRSARLSLADLARGQNLQLSLSLLHPFSRWITPEPLPRRYDTWFFVAKLPDGQEAIHDDVETTESVWVAPSDAVKSWETGSFPLVFPTVRTLQRLAAFESIEQVLASTVEGDLEPITPRIIRSGGRETFLVPGDPGFDEVDLP